MFNEGIKKGLAISAAALYLTTGAAAQAEPHSMPPATPATGVVGAAALQLAARSDVFAATAAGLTVVPANMAGACPRSFELQIDLGARSPGTLSYRIETLDGRVSQVFKARTEGQPDGSFAAKAAHAVHLTENAEGRPDPLRVVFSAPTRTETDAETAGAAPEPREEPGFFERIFSSAGAGEDPGKGLSQQSFMVRVVAPNEVASAFGGPSVTCTVEELNRAVAAERASWRNQESGNGEWYREDEQDDGRDDDRGGRDGGRDSGGRDSGGRSSGGGGAGAGGAGAGGTID